MKKFTWYIRGELLCLVVGKSEEWWLAGQDVKQLTPRQLYFPIYGVSDKWWDGLAIMLHNTYPDEQLLNICYWFYFATDDHGRPNQRAESGPDGRKIGRRQKNNDLGPTDKLRQNRHTIDCIMWFSKRSSTSSNIFVFLSSVATKASQLSLIYFQISIKANFT